MNQELWFDALKIGNLELLRDYLNNGFDINCKDKNGFSILIWAFYNRNEKVISFAINDKNINVNLEDSMGYSILQNACDFESFELVKKYLLYHPKLNINFQDSNGITLLMKACWKNKLNIVKELLKHPNININLQDKLGYTALIWACYESNQDIVFELLKKDIDINVLTPEKQDAFIIACYKGHEEIIKELLIHKKLNLEQKDIFDKNGIDYLKMNNKYEIIKYIDSYLNKSFFGYLEL